ncbi:MAG TPA: LPS assembly protein LptD [Hyphomonadaceae bacterium]
MLRLTCLASAAVVALSAGATAAAQAPAAAVPATAPASEDIYLRADLVTEDQANLIMTAEGNVEVRVGDRTLKADKLIYDEGKQTMRAQGRVEITDADGSVQFSDEIEVDEDFRNGFATRFAARLAGNALITASSAVRTDGTRNSLEQVVYTGCPVCEAEGNEPTWSIRARRAEQNTETQMISYQDAVFEIKGIPVLYIPWFAHPDPSSSRRSGLLVPDLGVSSKFGPFYEQPYYWAISPSQEMTIAPMIAAQVNPLVKVDYRKLFFSGFVDFETSFTYEKDFNSDGDKFDNKEWRGHVYGAGRFNINQNWQWGFGVERQSDDLYDQRYDIDGEDDLRGLVASQPRQLMSQLYTTGQHEDFYFEAAVYDFQGLREFDNDAEFPEVAPSVFMQKLFDLGSNGLITADLSAVGLFRDAVETLPNGDLALDSARVTANAEWKAQYVFGPGLVLSPYVQARGDFYRVDDGSGGGAEEIGRALGVAGAQLSYPFIRRGENVDIIVEPVAMIAYGSEGANDDGIPNEDSQLFEGDDSNLLEPNPIPTYDLWEGGGRTALGVNTTVKFSDDTEVSALVARRWRQEEDPAFNDLSNLADETSDYVASIKADLGRVLNAGIRLRMDDDFSVNRIDVSANANIWRASGGARYFKIAENAAGQEDEGLVWNGALKISDRWSAIVEQSRNVTLGENIRLALGIAYRDDCSYFELVYQRDGGRDRTLGPSESIRFNFVLTGLGGLSTADAD